MTRPDPVFVLGAGGATGRVLVDELLVAGHRVTAAARNPAALPKFAPGSGCVDAARGLRVTWVDTRDADSMAAAVAGHSTVISAIGPPGRRPQGLYSETARSLVAALPATGVDRLLVMTSAGVIDDKGHALWYRLVARTLLRDMYEDMRRLEATIRSSTLEWTFVRPTRITDDPPTGSYRVENACTPARGHRISRVDLARFIVNEIDERQWMRAAPTLAY